MIHPSVTALLNHPQVRSAIERALAARGQHGDTLLIHADPREAAMLRFMGGVGTINPRTGLRQFYNPDAGHADPTGAAGVDRTGGGGFGAAGGGYGRASDTGGAGLGAGGGHSGQNYRSQQYGTNPAPVAATPAPVAPINNMPPAAPVTLDPMMSSTATTDLASSRFGALPSWATTPYQIGTAPSSYPTPGVNAALGAPNLGSSTLPTTAGAGGGGGGNNLLGIGYSNAGTVPIASQQQYAQQVWQKLLQQLQQGNTLPQTNNTLPVTSPVATGQQQQLQAIIQQARSRGLLGGGPSRW